MRTFVHNCSLNSSLSSQRIFMIKKLIAVLLILNAYTCALTNQEKTIVLRNELSQNDNPNLTKETHPILYKMLEKMTQKAGVEIPRYVTLFSTAQQIVSKDGNVYRKNLEIEAYVDALGDLHICNEILTDLSYNEIKGVLAVAISEKVANRPLKLVGIGTGTFGISSGLLYCANKKYNLHLGSYIYYERDYKRQQKAIEAIIGLLMIPTMITTGIVYNNLQKNIDIQATKYTKTQHVIDGITALERIKDRYYKEGIFSRIADMLTIKKAVRTIFYPVRGYTTAERIEYLKNEQAKFALIN